MNVYGNFISVYLPGKEPMGLRDEHTPIREYVVKILSTLGSDGWELVGQVGNDYTLKRPIE